MIKTKIIGLVLVLSYILFLPYDNDYITDWGNGVIIKGDRYVKSGDWAYNCKRWQLVSKIPRSFPSEHFKRSGQVRIYPHLSSPGKQEAAKAFIDQTLKTENWYERLRYVETYINESSQIHAHYFDLFAMHNGEQWRLSVGQRDNLNIEKAYSITADVYDARYDKSHEELLQEAKASCPKPQ